MASIRPFFGLRYSETAGPLGDCVAPPYDVLSPAQRDELAARNPHNVVHLTLPEQRDEDRSKFVKYARSAAALAEWRKQGALVREQSPSFYRYTQTFSIPGNDEKLTRTALIALIKVEPYEKGMVLPHEQTFPKHKEDRLRILEATRAHLECIYGLYEDPSGDFLEAVASAPVDSSIHVVTDDGVEHTVEPISDSDTCKKLSAEFEDRKVWIADGHHRYETACTFREAQGPKDGLIAEDFMMMALSSMEDPGLVLLPTHRILETLSVGEAQIDNKLQTWFHVRKVPNAHLMEELEEIQLGGGRAIGVALPSGLGLVVTLGDVVALAAKMSGEGSTELKSLDVSVLHGLIFEKLLGIRGLEGVQYTRDAKEACAAVEGKSGAAFLMNPPTVDDMRRIALGGEKMPQKSTFYYPKILSGLVLWSLGDFTP